MKYIELSMRKVKPSLIYLGYVIVGENATPISSSPYVTVK